MRVTTVFNLVRWGALYCSLTIFFFFLCPYPVFVGFEYESCPEFILWEKRTAILQGYETTASKLGGWALDKHHALNIQSGESLGRFG